LECRARLVTTYQDIDYCRREQWLTSVQTYTWTHTITILTYIFQKLQQTTPFRNLTSAERMYAYFQTIIKKART